MSETSESNNEAEIAIRLAALVADGDNFRWLHRKSLKKSKKGYSVHYFKCAQSLQLAKALHHTSLNIEKQRQTKRRLNYFEHNKMDIHIYSDHAIIYYHHQHHPEPASFEMPDTVIHYIQQHSGHMSAMEIYHAIQKNAIPTLNSQEALRITAPNIYYHWAKIDIMTYRRDTTELTSARRLIEETPGFNVLMHIDTDVQALAWITPFWCFVRENIISEIFNS